MRSGVCPKCSSDSILRRKAIRDYSAGGFDGNLALAGGATALHGGAGRGEFEVYCCRSCGYSELYVRNPEDLAQLSHEPVI